MTATLSLPTDIAPDRREIDAAAGRLAGHARETPLLSAEALDRIAGRQVLVKAECLQHTGSFKFRGAWSAVSALPPAVRARGVIGSSSGNHAQGLAFAARAFGAPCTIVMPSDAPAPKIAATRAFGAEVILIDRSLGEKREGHARALADARGLTMIPPYDHIHVIAGQGTAGLEIAAAYQGGPAEILVCCGGGGLSAGIALATEADPRLTVRTVEPEGFDDMARSLATGRRVRNAATGGSICDAILTQSPGAVTLPVLDRLAGAGLVVTDDACLAAMALALRHLKLVLEPGGAAALAAALFQPDALSTETVIAVATGGNVADAVLAQALSHPV